MSDPASPSPDDTAAIPPVPPPPPAVPPYAAATGAAPAAPQSYASLPAHPTPQGYPAPQGYGPPPYPAPQGYGPPAGYAQPSPYAGAAYPQRKTDALAIASLVCAIGGIVFSWTIVLGLASIAAVILGHLSLKRLKTSNDAGYGMAMAGTIIGWVGVGILILLVIFAVVLPILLLLGILGAATTYSS